MLFFTVGGVFVANGSDFVALGASGSDSVAEHSD